jgi:phage tail sheath protein FI
MAFQLSPGVNFSEIDLTNATAAVGTTEGAIAGVFRWGPVNERTLITSENQLTDVFGLPNTRYTADATGGAAVTDSFTNTWTNAETYTTAANFLGYSDALYVVRVENNALSAKIEDSGNVLFEGKYKGELGNSVEVSWCLGTDDNTGFTGVQMNAAANLTLTSATGGSIDEISSSAHRDKLKAGDRIKLPNVEQELVVKTVTIGESGSAGTALPFNPDSAPVIGNAISDAVPLTIAIADSVVSFTTTAGTPGVLQNDFILVEGAIDSGDTGSITSYDDTNGIVLKVGTVGTNTYQVLNTDGTNFTATAGSFTGKTIKKITTSGVNETIDAIVTTADTGLTAGTPIQFQSGDANPISAGGTALADGQILFAIPCNPSTGTTPSVHGTTAFKLASTYANAVAGTALALTAVSNAGSFTSSFAPFTEFGLDFTLENRFTGVTLPTAEPLFNIKWGDSDKFDAQPTVGNYHVLVKDLDGSVTGTAGAIIESYEDLSTSPTAKKVDGSTNFITDVFENNSNWIKLQTGNISKFTNLGTQSSGYALTGGLDGDDETKTTLLGSLAQGYDLFSDASEVDISFVLQGRPNGASGYELANYIIDNVAETRRDCVAFVSPPQSLTSATDIVEQFSSFVTRSSYAVVDSGYKYQYDKYNDVYKYIPLNGDIAGLCARTDDLRDPWFSPAGINRGNVKNVVKLNVNPNQAQRDLLYKNGVNPVITQPGQGTILFGDKTFQGKASAFDRINVRRLFIVLEKTIARAAKASLFEFNDEFTRAQFVNLVEPFLRDVQGRRGIYDFKVVCDDSNNTGQVIDTNSFVGDIYVKPARSINFIQLNFVAVRTGVEFSEVVGSA